MEFVYVWRCINRLSSMPVKKDFLVFHRQFIRYFLKINKYEKNTFILTATFIGNDILRN